MNATSRAIKKHADDLEAELAAVRAQLLVLESELGVARSLAKEALDQIAAKDAALRRIVDFVKSSAMRPYNMTERIEKIVDAALAAKARETSK
jgi:ATP/maltotriose-dependent transcriptional regulator MalT